MSVEKLFNFIKDDYELKCYLALAQFLEIKIGRVINLNRGMVELAEEDILKILKKTDLTREEISEMLAS